MKSIREMLMRGWRAAWVPPAMGKAPYVWTFSLLFMVWKYYFIPPTVLELVLLLVSVPLFLLIYFNSLWHNNLAVVPHLLGVVLIGLLWAPWNPGASCFFIFASSMCARFERGRHAYAAIVLVVASAVLAGHVLQLKQSFMLPVLIFGLPIGIASVMEGKVWRSREQLLRKQEEVAYLARIAERERISRDMHDLLGHTLSLITLKAELAGKLLERDVAACRNEIRDIEQSARTALSEVRAAVSGMRQSGFAHELAIARATLAAAQIGLREQLASCEMPAVAENVLALALREAVTNILRHGQATECMVNLQLAGAMLTLQVRDNGRSLADGSMPEFGNGLRGMQERVAALGGRLLLRVERGVTLEVALPVGGVGL
ncbi:sensor histidine kinase [Duganella fentianensis]|nr:sensor histidine kinase [Duganella fentianensis]